MLQFMGLQRVGQDGATELNNFAQHFTVSKAVLQEQVERPFDAHNHSIRQEPSILQG